MSSEQKAEGRKQKAEGGLSVNGNHEGFSAEELQGWGLAVYCLLPTAYCLLPSAHCPLPTE